MRRHGAGPEVLWEGRERKAVAQDHQALDHEDGGKDVPLTWVFQLPGLLHLPVAKICQQGLRCSAREGNVHAAMAQPLVEA